MIESATPACEKLHAAPSVDIRASAATPQATTRIYPIEVGLGGEYRFDNGLWIAGWVGATVIIDHARSDAQDISAIDYTGHIPAASQNDTSVRYGFGGQIGYDALRTRTGRGGLFLAITDDDIGPLPIRFNDGGFGKEGEDSSSLTYEAGISYAF